MVNISIMTTDKIPLTFNQLKKLIIEAQGRERARDLFAWADEEKRNGNSGYALSILKRHKDEIRPYFPEDYDKEVKRLEQDRGAEP